ncbi:MAG TPA: hypothetical protein V6C89_21755 [Drouetiella sp.]
MSDTTRKGADIFFRARCRLPCVSTDDGFYAALFAAEACGHKFVEPLLVRTLKESAVSGEEVLLEYPFEDGQSIFMIGRIKALVESGKAVIVDFSILRPSCTQPGLN